MQTLQLEQTSQVALALRQLRGDKRLPRVLPAVGQPSLQNTDLMEAQTDGL